MGKMGGMSFHIAGDDRQQTWLLPASIQDYVSEDNPVRVIDAFVEQLDLRNLGIQVQPAATGRPSYAPASLLKLFVYGYLSRVRSSRELERLSHRNLEVIWLLQGLRPDHKTLSEFRRRNKAAFKLVLRQFNLLCRELKLFGAELAAIDGSMFKAVNSRGNNFTLEKLESLIKATQAGIERYLADLERSDQEAGAGALDGGKKAATTRELKEKIEQLRATRERHESMLRELQEKGEKQASLIDPEARLMRKSTSKDSQVGYNVQSVVDAAHHLIVEVEATTQCNDFGQLNSMAQQAKDQLGVEQLTVVADGGYYALADLKAAEEQGIEAHVPGQRDTMEKAGLFARREFRYDEARDEYECPGKARLTRHGDSQYRGQVLQAYYNTAACAGCALRSRCTTGRYRKINHGAGHPQVQERIRQRMEQRPEVYAQRKSLVEHPFGTIKFWWGQSAFLTKGRASVNAEIALSALAYNLRRALNILGAGEILKHLATRTAAAA